MMKVSDWRDMCIYGITVLSALVLLFGPYSAAEEKTSLQNYSLVDSVNETYYDSENLTVYISGNTSLPNPASELIIESVNYSEEEGLMEVQLGSRDASPSGTVAPTVIQKPVPYSFKATFSEELPESVIIYGVFQEVEAFSPDESR